jgi:hypothetical protein
VPLLVFKLLFFLSKLNFDPKFIGFFGIAFPLLIENTSLGLDTYYYFCIIMYFYLFLLISDAKLFMGWDFIESPPLDPGGNYC